MTILLDAKNKKIPRNVWFWKLTIKIDMFDTDGRNVGYWMVHNISIIHELNINHYGWKRYKYTLNNSY